MRVWPPLLLAIAACGDDGIAYEGTAGQPIAATFDGVIPAIPVTAGDEPARRFLCDSGAPVTILDASSFPSLGVGVHRVDLGAFGLVFPDWTSASWEISGDDAVAGLVGGDLLRHFAFSIDYQGERVWLSDPWDPRALPAGIAAGDELLVPFELRGGGRGRVPGCPPAAECDVQLAPTRVVLAATFEAQAEPVWVVVDSGASAVVVDEAYLAELGDADRRPRLEGVRVNTVQGDVDAVLVRVWRVALGGAAATDLPVLVLPASQLLDAISAEVGRPVRALIGGTMLRHFLATLDYQEGALRLRPYHDPPVPEGEFVGPALSLAQQNDDWLVAEVYPGFDAYADGLRRGDVIDEIDGMPLRGQPGEVVDAALARFGLGDEVPMRWRRGTLTGEAAVLVEDFLPSYPPP